MDHSMICSMAGLCKLVCAILADLPVWSSKQGYYAVLSFLYCCLVLQWQACTGSSTTGNQLTAQTLRDPAVASEATSIRMDLAAMRYYGYNKSADFFEILAGNSSLPETFTLFAPSDTAISWLQPSHAALELMQYHIVPWQRLEFNEIYLLPQSTRFPTLLSGQSILVTATCGPPGSHHFLSVDCNFTLDGMGVVAPELWKDQNTVIHGVEGMLDPSEFGESTVADPSANAPAPAPSQRPPASVPVSFPASFPAVLTPFNSPAPSASSSDRPATSYNAGNLPPGLTISDLERKHYMQNEEHAWVEFYASQATPLHATSILSAPSCKLLDILIMIALSLQFHHLV